MRKIPLLLAILGLSAWGSKAMAQYCAAAHANTCAQSALVTSMSASTGFNPTLPTTCGASPANVITGGGTNTLTLLAGSAVSFTVAVQGVGNNDYSLWVDYDNNQAFDASEWIDLGRNVNTAGNLTVNITAPITSTTRPTMARLRSRGATFGNNDVDACTSFSSGVSYDFDVNITAAAACSGAPAVPVLTAIPDLCATDSVLVGTTSGYANSGLRFRWQRSTDGGSTWGAAPGIDTLPQYRLRATSFSAGNQLRLVVTCVPSGQSSVGTATTLVYKAANQCYCTPIFNAGCFDTELLRNLSSSTGWNVNLPTACVTSSFYDVSTSDTLDLTQGATVAISGTTGADAVSVALWVDYNKNGVFEAYEYTLVAPVAATGGPFSGQISVPGNALTGLTKGRIRTRVSNLNTDPCAAYGSGSGYDFMVNVAAGVACTNVTAASITSDSTGLCSNQSSVLRASGFTSGIGIRHQWQVSTDGGTTWNNLSAADTALTATLAGSSVTAGGVSLRLLTTCTVSGQSAASNVVTVAKRSAAVCACTPTNSSCTTGDLISRLTVNNGFALATPTACTGNTTGYFNITGATDTLRINPGGGYLVIMGSGASSLSGSLWVDFDQDGTFGINEWVDLGRSIAANAVDTGILVVPVTAVPGLTKARVRTRLAGNDNNSNMSCDVYFSGHTYDFPVLMSTTVGLQNTALSTAVQVYPNPASHEVNVVLPGFAQQASIRIADLAGRTVVGTQQATPGANRLSLNLSAGVYQVVITTAQGMATKKLVVQ